jgi:5-methylcytosine-specific restriction endonuclease McrA
MEGSMDTFSTYRLSPEQEFGFHQGKCPVCESENLRDIGAADKCLDCSARISVDDNNAYIATVLENTPSIQRPNLCSNSAWNAHYGDYLETEHWKKTKRLSLMRAAYKCQICAEEKNLNVHHNSYDRLGSELISDLVVLCRSCHSKFHDKIGKSPCQNA